MSINIKELQELLKKAAQKYIPVEEAEYFADQQIDTHLKNSRELIPWRMPLKIWKIYKK